MTPAEKLAKAVALLEVADASLSRAAALVRAVAPPNDSKFGREGRRINYEACTASDAARKLAESLEAAADFVRDPRCCRRNVAPYCTRCGRYYEPEGA